MGSEVPGVWPFVAPLAYAGASSSGGVYTASTVQRAKRKVMAGQVLYAASILTHVGGSGDVDLGAQFRVLCGLS